MRFVGATLIVLGLLIIMGTAGASDLGLLTMGDIVIRSMVGLATMGVGIVTVQITNEVHRINNRKEHRKHERNHH